MSLDRDLVLAAIGRILAHLETLPESELSADLSLVTGYARGALDRPVFAPVPRGVVESNVRLALALGRIAKTFGYADGECEPELLAMTVELFTATLTPCHCGHGYVQHRTTRCSVCACETFEPVPWGSSAHKRIEYLKALKLGGAEQ